jgi:hypothetical protein
MSSENSRTIRNLYPPANETEREAVLQFAREAPLAYGPWRHLKWLYKRAEETGDRELLGLLMGRMDAVPFPAPLRPGEAPPNSIDAVWDIALAGSVACLIRGDWSGRALETWDMSDPVRPVRLGAFGISQAQHLDVMGSHACVLSDRYLLLVDVSDPMQPRQARTARLDLGSVAGLAAVEPYVCVVRRSFSYYGQAQLLVVDCSDPVHPVVRGQVDIPVPAAIAAAGRSVVIGTQSDYRRKASLCVVYIGDPAHPRVVGSLDLRTNLNPGDVTLYGSLALVTLGEAGYYGRDRRDPGLRVIDLSRPDHPRQIAALNLGYGRGVAVQDNRALVAATGTGEGDYPRDGLRIVDISDPARPRVLGSVPMRSPVDVKADGPYAFVTGGAAGYYQARTLRVADVSDPAKPIFLGDPPSRRTLAYVKRRARRRLRDQAAKNADAFLDLAFRVLTAPDQRRESLDLRCQWVAAEILYGGSERYGQKGHGRGAYILRNPRFCLRTREERLPEAWDRRPELVMQIMADAGLPWQTYEAALKMLRAAGTPAPELSEASLSRFLRSPSPLLIATATRQAAARMEAGTPVHPALAAAAYVLSGVLLRRTMREYALLRGEAPSWKSRFAARLFERATANLADGRMTRRQATAAALLAADFPADVEAESIRPVLPALFAANRPDLRRWAFDTIRRVAAAAVPGWMEALSLLPDDHRDMGFRVLLETVREQAFRPEVAGLLIHSALLWVRARGWELLAGSATADEVVRELWEELLDVGEDTTALETAFESPEALALLNRVRIDPDRFMERLQANPILVRLLTPAAFESVVRAVPVDAALRLIAAAPDEQWAGLRAACVSGLHEAGKLGAFWQEALAAVGADATGILRRRLLDDPEMAGSILRVDDPDLLKVTDPAFGPLLARWAMARPDLFARDSSALLQAATHMLPEIRTWALDRVREGGMSLPFALRLLESELPPSVAVGRTFFEAALPGGEWEMEYALALCDSPKASVRAYGREYVSRRWETLPRADLLARLAENSDPLTQEFVAAALLKAPEPAPDFDWQVLRSRDRSRRAKELVKRRRAGEAPAEPSPADVAMLLEMARSRTPRDAEWALAQLALLSLQGVKVEGLMVEGEAAI